MKPTRDELEARDLLGLAKRCARSHGVMLEEMLGRGRTAAVADARRSFYRALIQDLGWSAAAVGRLVGRHHSSVLLALGSLARCKRALPPAAPDHELDLQELEEVLP